MTKDEIKEKLETDLGFLQQSILDVYAAWRIPQCGFQDKHYKVALGWVKWIQQGNNLTGHFLQAAQSTMVQYVEQLSLLRELERSPQEKFVLTKDEVTWISQQRGRCLIDLVDEIKQERDQSNP